MKKIVSIGSVLALMVGTLTFGVGSALADPAPAPINVASISILDASSQSSASLAIGATDQLTAVIKPANATDQNVVWSSGSSTLASVSATGLVMGLSAGTTTITATILGGGVSFSDVTSTFNVTVTSSVGPVAPPTYVTSVSILDASSSASADLAIGATDQLTATVTPASSTDQNITWSSDDSAIASVASSTGLITANAVGTTTITALSNGGDPTVNGGNVTTTFAVTVAPNADASLSDLEVDGVTVSGFTSSTLTYSVSLPSATATIPTVTATTNDLNATDTITQATALPGSATVLVTAQDGSTAENYIINFTVPSPVVSPTITITASSSLPDATVGVPYDEFITATSTNPGDVLIWTIGGLPNDLNYDSSTGEITGTPVASSTNTLSVTVVGANPSSTPANATIGLNVDAAVATSAPTSTPVLGTDASLSDLEVNSATVTGFASSTMTYAVVLPAGTTQIPTVTAMTNDLNATDTITQASSPNGSATVLVTAQDGVTTSTYTINFTVVAPGTPIVPVTAVTVIDASNQTSTTLGVGGTDQLTATLTPASSTNQGLAWSSSDVTIATVDTNGLVTAIAPGTATITATASDTTNGIIGATFGVTVSAPVISGGGGGGSVSTGGGGGDGGGGNFFNPYTIKIDGGAPQTNSANVLLSLTAVAGMNQIWISNDSSFATSTGTGWIPFQASYPWTLASNSGNQTVYAEFGNASTTSVAGTAEASITVVPAGQVLGAATTGSGGQVLGASAYNFTESLSLGSKGADVTALQNLLTEEGFYTGPITGYFGLLTQAGVRAFQTAHGLDPVGRVGPLTLALLNQGFIPTSDATSTAAIEQEIQTLTTQLASLEAQVKTGQ